MKADLRALMSASLLVVEKVVKWVDRLVEEVMWEIEVVDEKVEWLVEWLVASLVAPKGWRWAVWLVALMDSQLVDETVDY